MELLGLWLVVGLWLLVVICWCCYQHGYTRGHTRGLCRARKLYEPALDQLVARAQGANVRLKDAKRKLTPLP